MVELEIQNLGFSYKSHKVFQNINLSADQGEILSLVGPNGAGKTTLLKCINLLHTANQGDIFIEGQNIKQMTRLEMAKKIAYVSQNGQVNFPISVFDAVLLGRKPHIGMKVTQHDLDLVFEVLCQMNIDHLSGKHLNELSGGERQKVMIAKALVQEPEILLLDEPTTFLDLGYQMKIMQVVRDLVDEKKICAIITTHELNYALQYSERIAILKDGEILVHGAPDIVDEEVIRKVYGIEAHIREEGGHPFLVPYRVVS